MMYWILFIGVTVLSYVVQASFQKKFQQAAECPLLGGMAGREVAVRMLADHGIRDVVLYHMPFGSTEFNQMSGRAGRDGRPARIHLLFGSRDAHINESLLAAAAPARSDLVALYRVMLAEARRAEGMLVDLDDSALVERVHAQSAAARLDEAAVASGIAVFEELGFLARDGFDESRRIRMNPSPAHADLVSSIRYSEGRRSLREFVRFRDWVLSATSQEMLSRINRPIVPSFGCTVDR